MTVSSAHARSNAETVPCNGCTLCCQNDMIFLHPEMGDDPAQYETVEARHPFTGQMGHMVAKKPGSTDCIYLGEGGCTIHGRAPSICRVFDCGKLFASRTRAERRRDVSNGLITRAVIDQGRRVQSIRAASPSPLSGRPVT